MKALLLAAGLGTRLRPLTDLVPKCMVPVNGRPLLSYWLELCQGEMSSVLINLHYKSEIVEDYLTSLKRVDIDWVHEEELLGTGGTLLKNREYFARESAMLIHADNLSYFNMQDFVKAHKERPKDCAVTMMLFESEDPQSCGIVELDPNGRVQKFHEKVESPPGNLANGAVYIVEPEVIDFMAEIGKDFVDFSTEVLPYYVGRIYTFQNQVYHRDIGQPESFLRSQREFEGASEGSVSAASQEGSLKWSMGEEFWQKMAESLVETYSSKNVIVLERDSEKELLGQLGQHGVEETLYVCKNVSSNFCGARIYKKHKASVIGLSLS